MIMPYYRIWVILISSAVCIATWFMIERTQIGSYLRAATENPMMVGALGVNVPLLLTVTYAISAGLAGMTGVLAVPLYSANPLMGIEILIVHLCHCRHRRTWISNRLDHHGVRSWNT